MGAGTKTPSPCSGISYPGFHNLSSPHSPHRHLKACLVLSGSLFEGLPGVHKQPFRMQIASMPTQPLHLKASIPIYAT